MKVFKKLDIQLGELLKSRKAFGGIVTKEDLTAKIDLQIRTHIAVIETIDKFVGSIGNGIAVLISAETEKYPAYMEYKTALSPKQKSLENDKFMFTLLEANRKYVEVLHGLKENMDEYFLTERISVLNMRASHLIIAGVMQQSAGLVKFTKYLLGYVSNILMESGINNRYREPYLMEHGNAVAGFVSAINEGRGANDYKAIINNIKKAGADHTLISKDDNKSQAALIEKSVKLGKSSKEIVEFGILGLPHFRTMGESINLMRNSVEKYLHQEISWMRTHVALLNTKVNSGSSSSDDRIQLLKIIKRYESIMDKLERARSKFE